MRRRSRIVLSAWVAGCALLGCNLIIGSESAIFDPTVANGGGEGGDESSNPAETSTNDQSSGDGSSGDAAADAGPCINTDTNPKHCGKCGHDCLGGGCVAAKCQPFIVASEPGTMVAIALDSTHVYWTNPATGNVRRAPIGGGAAETVFDGPTGTPLGDSLVVSAGHVYFAPNDLDSGVVRCPAAGCGAAAPESVVGQLDNPVIGVDDAGTILVLESFNGGRVGRCTPPCAGGLDVVAPAEAFPLFVTAEGTSVYWTTILPGQGTVRARPAGAATPKTLVSATGVDLALVGPDVIFLDRSKGPEAVALDGGTARRLSAANSSGERLTVSDGIVYYTDWIGGSTGKIIGCATTGCGDSGVVLATAQLGPHALVADSKSVWWTNRGDNDGGAAIMRVAK